MGDVNLAEGWLWRLWDVWRWVSRRGSLRGGVAAQGSSGRPGGCRRLQAGERPRAVRKPKEGEAQVSPAEGRGASSSPQVKGKGRGRPLGGEEWSLLEKSPLSS